MLLTSISGAAPVTVNASLISIRVLERIGLVLMVRHDGRIDAGCKRLTSCAISTGRVALFERIPGESPLSATRSGDTATLSSYAASSAHPPLLRNSSPGKHALQRPGVNRLLLLILNNLPNQARLLHPHALLPYCLLHWTLMHCCYAASASLSLKHATILVWAEGCTFLVDADQLCKLAIHLHC